MRKSVKFLYLVFSIILVIGVFAGAVYGAGASALQPDRLGTPIQGALRPVVAQSISFTSVTAVNGTNFSRPIIRVTTTQNCYYKFGTDNTVEATSSDHYLGAGSTEYFNVSKVSRIAVIRATTSGTFFISEME
jgi:hypothetical protein